MSKIGKKPIIIPKTVNVEINDGVLNVKGKSGEIILKILPHMKLELKDGMISVNIDNDSRIARTNWGTMRSLIQNAIIGIEEGFSKILEIEGVGYRATMEGDNLVLNIGFSHQVKIASPLGVKISVEKNTIKLFGIDKFLVGETAAKIRAMKKPEPYKGKGIRYQGELIRRKEGKKAASATT
mgnify:CR=1 FL=1